MINLNDLRSINLLNHFDDERLKKIEKITKIIKPKKGEYLFMFGEYAENLYAVINGKIGLEMPTGSDTGRSVYQLPSGRTFGVSSMVDTERKTYISNAKAIEDSLVYMWKAADLEKLLYQDYEFGFLFMKKVGGIIKRRLQRRNAQYVDMLSNQ